MRKHLKNTNNNKKIQSFLNKYNIPTEFTSTSRKMISRGAALGVFIAMIPMPFQMVAVLFFMPVFRFNVPIALIMCWVTNPFTMPLFYYIEYLTGSFILGSEVGEVSITLQWFQENLSNILLPLYLGAIFYSIILSIIIYFLINRLWINSVHNDRKEPKKPKEKNN